MFSLASLFTPITVDATTAVNAEVTAEVFAKAWLKANEAGLKSVRQVRARKMQTFAGDTLHQVKIAWRDAGGEHHISGVTLDQAGNVIADHGKAIRDKASKARWLERGVFGAKLHRHVGKLKNKPRSESVMVDLLMQVPYTLPDKTKPAAIAASKAAHTRALAKTRNKLLNHLQQRYGVRRTNVRGEGAMVRFTASAQTLARMQHDTELGLMDLGVKAPSPQSLSVRWGESILGWNTGFTGANVDVCLIEPSKPIPGLLDYIQFASTRFSFENGFGHPAEMASLIVSDGGPTAQGLAPGANLHLANWASIIVSSDRYARPPPERRRAAAESTASEPAEATSAAGLARSQRAAHA